ncbi:AtpZ/AtpI family protein [Pseudobutyrivibrio sp. MD2005]|uniref:AtpZ/AtpI family protein n=1 Tax=Pseudobutyrivibrio sp. MD2005 TaxID=1410616 RepID=UPI00055C608E|nr:AtpZ/AtpI family protein [Pseudobutyrivibrio sp. MD2005]
MKDKKKARGDVANSLVMVLQLGINVMVPILLCTVVGAALANHFGSKGFTIGGILIGVVAACNGAYRYLKGYLKRFESKEKHD